MVRLIKVYLLVLFIFIPQLSFSIELNEDEETYFNFIDFNNDNQISESEIEQSINIIFQLVDFNQDGFISKSEINELKTILESLK